MPRMLLESQVSHMPYGWTQHPAPQSGGSSSAAHLSTQWPNYRQCTNQEIGFERQQLLLLLIFTYIFKHGSLESCHLTTISSCCVQAVNE